MNRMPIERAKQEIDDGIASVKAALGDDAALAPFFRIPGLVRADGRRGLSGVAGHPGLERGFSGRRLAAYFVRRGSTISPSSGWRPRARGILLLHDIQARTVAALPRILHEMKARGYRIVHVVPATADRPATPTEPQQWQLHPPSENVAISHWPKIPEFRFRRAPTCCPRPRCRIWIGGRQCRRREPFDRARRHAAAFRCRGKRPGRGNRRCPPASAAPCPSRRKTCSRYRKSRGTAATARAIAVCAAHELLRAEREDSAAAAVRRPTDAADDGAHDRRGTARTRMPLPAAQRVQR